MQINQVTQLFNYNYWANQRLLDAAAGLSSEQFVAPASASHGSVRDTLVHTLLAEWLWRLRCGRQALPPTLMSAGEFPTLAGLRARWQTEEEAMRAYLATLTDADLLQPLPYLDTAGRPHQPFLWQILLHLVNHGTQTRSETAMLLTDYGHSPGDLDFIYYVFDHC